LTNVFSLIIVSSWWRYRNLLGSGWMFSRQKNYTVFLFFYDWNPHTR